MGNDYDGTYVVCVDDDNNILDYTFWIVRAEDELKALEEFEEYLRRTYQLTNKVLENLKPFRILKDFWTWEPKVLLQDLKTHPKGFWDGGNGDYIMDVGEYHLLRPSGVSPDIITAMLQLQIYFPKCEWINRIERL